MNSTKTSGSELPDPWMSLTKESGSPAGPSSLVTDRSAAGATVVVMVVVLLALSVSVSSEVTVATFEASPTAASSGTTTMTTVAVASAVTSPRSQVTVPLLSEQLP